MMDTLRYVRPLYFGPVSDQSRTDVIGVLTDRCEAYENINQG